MNKKIILATLVTMLMITTVFGSISIVKADKLAIDEEQTGHSQITISSLESPPPDLLDQECTSGDSCQSASPPAGGLRQTFEPSVMFITKFEVKLSRTGTENNCFLVISLIDKGETKRGRTMLFNDILETPTWYTCSFNDLGNEDELKTPYVIEADSELSLAIQIVGGSVGSEAEINWHGDSNNPYGMEIQIILTKKGEQ